MPSRNTKFARNRGYSDIKQMNRDDDKRPQLKNFRVRLGRTVDSQLERQKRGKAAANPNNSNNSHWATDSVEERRRKESWR